MQKQNEYYLPEDLYERVKHEEESEILYNMIVKEKLNVFLTGAGGSGKTYLTRNLLEKLSEKGITYAVTATTGIAAKNLTDSGSTYHKFLNLGIVNNLEDYSRRSFPFADEIKKKLVGLDLLIIEEVSMCSANMLDVIITHLQKFKFTGRIMLIGDFFQLPPIISDNDIDDNYYLAFQSNNWNFVTMFLNRMKRTNDVIFTNFMNEIRTGTVSDSFVKYLSFKDVDDLNMSESDLDNEFTKLFASNKEANVVNDREVEKIESELLTFDGIWIENKEIVYYRSAKDKDIKRQNHMETILVNKECNFKVGERVMIIVNDKNDNYHNGDIGVIEKVDYIFDTGLDRRVPVLFIRKKTGLCITVKPHEFTFEALIGKEYMKIDSFVQLPIIPAYAITVHKSQGLSIDNLYIDFGKFFAQSQAYVALSRVVNPDNLYIKNFSSRKVYPPVQAVWFYNNIRDINNNIYSYFYKSNN